MSTTSGALTSALGAIGQETPWTVMVLAHNEEANIVQCLDSVYQSEPNSIFFDIFVMANGSSDRTESLVRDYGRRKPDVHLVSTVLGDKCNAWNSFVHDVVPMRGGATIISSWTEMLVWFTEYSLPRLVV